jgi:hypothetical protein
MFISMQTVFETRKIRLGILKKQYIRWAALNEAIGWDKTSARLSQINSGTMRKDRDTPYVMGDTMAREIETALHLATGWMDTPPTYAELDGDDRQAQMLLAMESIPEDLWPTARRLLAALEKPEAKNGTTGQ